MASSPRKHDDYTVGWVCALPKEQTAAISMLDERHDNLPKPPNDSNAYTLGSIGRHNIVIACPPKGKIGTSSVAGVASHMVGTFPGIRFGLMVGIGGGALPKVRLGDVVVSVPTEQLPGTAQWDMGRAEDSGHSKRTGTLNNIPISLHTGLAQLKHAHNLVGSRTPKYLKALQNKNPRLAEEYLRSNRLKDNIFEDNVSHVTAAESSMDKTLRNIISIDLGRVWRLEAGAAGLLDNFPYIAIRGSCDYADSLETNAWQGYAAATAAAFAKELLEYVKPSEVAQERTAQQLLGEKVDDILEDAKQVQNPLLSEEDCEILDWLTPLEYGPLHNDYLKRVQKGTGDWFLQSKEYLDWLTTPQETLFCPGSPGSGKTIITSMVINDIENRFSSADTVGIAYIYFDFRGEESQTVNNLSSCLVKQLARSQRSLPGYLRDIYEAHRGTLTRPTLEESSRALQSLVALYRRVYIIVDALDECQTSDGCRTDFLSQMFSLQTSQKTNIFVTSRHLPGIASEFTSSLSLEIQAKREDVSRYVESQIRRMPSCVQNSLDMQKEIIASISEASEGIFLLAHLYVDSLKDKLTRVSILGELSTIIRPQKKLLVQQESSDLIDRAYEKHISRIDGHAKESKEAAFLILSWVMAANRPLQALELQHALANQPGRGTFANSNISELKDLVSECSDMFTVDENNVLRFTHHTTFEYLEKTKTIWLPEAQNYITRFLDTYHAFRGPGSDTPQSREYRERHRLAGLLGSTASQASDVDKDSDTRDLESLASNVSAVVSTKSSNTAYSHIQGVAVQELVDCLARDSELHVLFEIATHKVDRARFIRNFRRLLKAYGSNLSDEASDDPQRDAANFVQRFSHQVAINLGFRLMRKTYHSYDLQSHETSADVSGRLNECIEPQSSFSGEIAWSNGMDEQGDLSDGYDSDELDVPNLPTATLSLAAIKEFLLTADALIVLRNDLRQWLNTDRKTRDSDKTALRVILPNETNKLPGKPPSIQTPYTAEQFTVVKVPEYRTTTLPIFVNSIVDKFPFYREPPRPSGTTRVKWKCSCGSWIFDDVVELRPGAAEELSLQLGGHNDAESLTLARPGQFQHMFQKLFGPLRGIYESVVVWLSGHTSKHLQTNTQNPGLPMHAPSNNAATSTVSRPGQQNSIHLLMCIDQGCHTTILFQEYISNVADDREVFSFLRAKYFERRKFTSWFTLRCLKSLSLAKFNVDANDFAAVNDHNLGCLQRTDCVCIPPIEKVHSKEYSCSPAPEQTPSTIPALTQNRLTHYFLKPDCLKNQQTSILLQLPKRTGGRLTGLEETFQEGWGLHFEEEWNWPTIWLTCGVFIIFSLIFGVVWAKVTGDIQSGFAVSAVVVAIPPIPLALMAQRDRI